MTATVTATAAGKAKKSVRWATITIHEFGVGLGGSAVSNKGGPSIGLADGAPEFTWTTKVGEMAECSEGVHRFSPAQRVRLLQRAGVSDGMIERHAKEASIILGSRRRAVLDNLRGDRQQQQQQQQAVRKRSAEQAALLDPRPCAVPLRRPRMIPANYV